MDFSLTTLFVATSGTLASTGSTQNLTGGQIGVFSPTYTILNTGTIVSQPYIYIAEGRIENVPGLGSKRSDKIAANKVIDWYKVTAISNIPVQVQSIANWNLECGQQVTFTFVLHSSYLDTAFFNGLTVSTVVDTPCCNCGANPCASVTGAALDTFIDTAVAQLSTLVNAPGGTPDASGFQVPPLLSNFLTFSRFGSAAAGGSPQLIITELPLTIYANPCDLEAYPWEYDRLWFRAFVIQGPVTTQDFIVADACNIIATSTVVQRSLFGTGSSAEIAQLEKNLYSYQTNSFKHLYKYNSWNGAFTSYVTANTYYDTYYIKYVAYDDRDNWNPGVAQDETVIIAFPTGTGTTFETLLTAYLGAPTDWSGTNPTTTTTTSTSSTTTTSTSTLIP